MSDMKISLNNNKHNNVLSFTANQKNVSGQSNFKEAGSIEIPAFMVERQRQKNYEKKFAKCAPLERDEFTKSKSKKTNNSQYKKGFMTGCVAALAILASAGGIKYQTQKVPTVAVVEYDTGMGMSLDEIAESYDSTVEIIEAYNGDDIENLEEIGVPRKIELLDDKIDSLKNSLYKGNLDEESIIEITDEIQQLEKMQEYQNAIADVYQDGNMIYFVIKDVDENMPEELYDFFYHDYYSASINVEDFKELFSIKDGAIKDNNDLNFFWDDNSDALFGGKSGLRNWTNNYFHPGDVIKVGKNDINYENALESFAEFEDLLNSNN